MNCTFAGQITSIIREPEDLSISIRPIKHSEQERCLEISTTQLLDETLERLGATIPGRMDEIMFLDTSSIKIIGLKVETGAACNVVQT